MKIETKPLLIALSDPVKVSTRRTTLPILNCLLITHAYGQLSIAATDLDVWVERHIDHKEADLPVVCVNAKRFHQCVANGGEYVTLGYDEKRNRLIVSSGSWKQELGVLDQKEFPARPDIKGKAIPINFGDLAASIESVAWAASDDPKESRPFTQTVLVSATAKKLVTYGFAGKVLARNVRPLISGDTEFHLPAAQAGLLVDAMRSDEAEVVMSEKRITVSHKGGMVSAVLMQAEWPDVTKVTGLKASPLGKVPRNDLLNSCRRISGMFGQEKFGRLHAKVEDKSLMLEAVTATDSAVENVMLSEPKEGGFMVDVFLLQDAVAHLEEGGIELRCNDRQLFLEQGERTIIISLLVDVKPK